jgi:hypothetical protein
MTLITQISIPRKLIQLFYVIFFSLFIIENIAGQLIVNSKIIEGINQFPVVSNNIQSKIIYDNNDYEVVKIASIMLAEDIERVSGKKPAVISERSAVSEYIIIIGSVDRSGIIKELSDSKKIVVDKIAGGWEQYSFKTILNPYPGVKQALVISGSDRRGTAYGIFELSRTIGISPWYWWADVSPEKKANIFINPVDYISEPPSVKYRGIFLNDEDWGLQPWAAKTYEPETGDIGPKTYKKIFELMLRLKANLIWPAMHSCTKSFYHYPENKKVADSYGIIVGSSHAEPMLCNNVDEWHKATMGEFNYKTNREAVYKYWEKRILESRSFENIYTLGMRGIHDSGMDGAASVNDKINLLQEIIKDQRNLLKNYINQDVTKIPQVFIPYKEVLEIYDSGLRLPEDITIIWPDDNYGYIQRLNNTEDNTRSGGSGVYYHLSYWGRPHDYLWLSSTHPMLIREELYKAYLAGSNQIWVFNVGDIKPLEYNIQLSLDMAFNIKPFSSSQYVDIHLRNWICEIFSSKISTTLSAIFWEYYNLAFERKPEFMGWNQTEPTRVPNNSEYNHYFYNDEAQKRLDRYNKISCDVSYLSGRIPEEKKDAFYELVYYPIRCAALINRKFLHLEKAYLYAKQYRASANDHAIIAKLAYDSIMIETKYYNEILAGGKWKYMMSMNPRNLPVFDCPLIPMWEVPDTSCLGISAEGYKGEKTDKYVYGNRLPVFYKEDDKYFIDVFITGKRNLYWEASVSHPCLKLSKYSDTLKGEFLEKEERLWVSIDFDKIPPDFNHGKILFICGDQEIPVFVDIFTKNNRKIDGYCEMNGYISVHAEHYSGITQTPHSFWQVIDNLGYTGKAIALLSDYNYNQGKKFSHATNPSLEYEFYNHSTGKTWVNIYCLPMHALNNNHQLRIAVSIDDQRPQVIDYKTIDRSELWKQNVLRNMATIHTEHFINSPGRHILKITALDPCIIIDRIIVDFGGFRPSYSAVKETKLK